MTWISGLKADLHKTCWWQNQIINIWYFYLELSSISTSIAVIFIFKTLQIIAFIRRLYIDWTFNSSISHVIVSCSGHGWHRLINKILYWKGIFSKLCWIVMINVKLIRYRQFTLSGFILLETPCSQHSKVSNWPHNQRREKNLDNKSMILNIKSF